MKEIAILGTIITSKASAAGLIGRLYSRFDGTMESSVAISNVEDVIVKAGFLTWDEVEAAELAA